MVQMQISLTNMNANKLLMSVQGFKEFWYNEQAITSDHNSSELGIHDHNNEPSSSKLVPKIVPPADKTATSRQKLELLFHHYITMMRWKPMGKIFKTVGFRWVPTGKIFTSITTKIDSEPTNGSNADITNQYECEQTLDVSAEESESDNLFHDHIQREDEKCPNDQSFETDERATPNTYR
nr:hypothetical protein [Tanacetum cinerariifolium]